MEKPPRFSEQELYSAIRAAQRAGAVVTLDITADKVRLTIGEKAATPTPSVPQLREILTIKDIAAHWCISAAKVRSMIERGEITHFRVGSLIRVRREEILRIDAAGGGVRGQITDEELERLVSSGRKKKNIGEPLP